METSAGPGRIPGLDLMKVLGLYLVVLYHLTFRHAQDVLGGGLLSAAVYLPSTFVSICVPLFFTASGALSLTRPLDLKKNTLRCLHLAVLLLFWTGASLLIVLALRHQWPGFRELVTMATELRVGYIQHLWYLPTFLFLTLLLPVLHGLKNSSRRIWRYGVLLLGIFTFGNQLLNDLEYLLRWLLGLGGHAGTRYFFWYVDYFAYHYWYSPIYLALGAFLLENRHSLARRKKLAAGAIPLCLVILTLFGVARTAVRGMAYDPAFNNYGDPFTLLLTAAVAVLLLDLQPRGLVRRAAESMSRCSLGIYLIHWLLIEVLLDYFPAVPEAVVWAPLTAIPVLGLSWALTALLLRVPVVKNLFTATPDWLRSAA